VKALANLRINNPATFQRLNQVKAQLIAAGNTKADYEDSINALYVTCDGKVNV
jgi:hypothetical protein